MKVTPDDYGRRCQFDHFCKLVLYHEAVDYFRERKRQRGWETSFETLPLSELDTLCTIDQYPSDSFIFPAYGCELQISDGLVAAAFASLPQPGQSILILHCVLELTDGEIGAVVGMSRSGGHVAACVRRLFLCFVLPVSFPLALGLLTASHPFGAGRAVFGPVRLRLERGPTLAAAFHFIPVFDDFGVQGSVQWEDGCLKPPAQQRIGNALYANTFLAIVQ